MKKACLLILVMFSVHFANAQKAPYISYKDFLSFENYKRKDINELGLLNKFLSDYSLFVDKRIWFTDLDENCSIRQDSTQVHHGKYSLKIEPRNSHSIYNFDIVHSFIGEPFKGDSLLFGGWYKGNTLSSLCESNVSDSISFYIYQANHTIKEVKLPLTEQWQHFNLQIPNINPQLNSDIGVKYQGKTTIWLDDLSFSVDGQTPDEIYPVTPADLDHEFDNSSRINLPDSLSPATYKNLETLCKVWGFLKYYHPSVQIGMYDWNYELFRILPKVLACMDNASVQTVLSQWIKDLNPPTIENNRVENKDSILFYPDFKWINPQELGSELTKQLKEIQEKPRPFYNHSVFLYHLGYPIFNEPLYEKMSWEDDGYRLLCLFRYWNIINYFHPYRPYFRNDWQQLLPAYIRLFAEAKDLPDFEKAIFRIAAESKDAHTEVYSPSNYTPFNIGQIESYQIPLDTKVYPDGLLVTGYWFEETPKMGLNIGDVITGINGESIEKIRRRKDPFFSFSNENGMINTYPLLSVSQDSAWVSYIRQGEEKEILVKNLFGYFGGKNGGTPVEPSAPASKRIISKEIAYLNPLSYKKEDLSLQLDSLKGFPYLILDFRKYPIDNAVDTVLADFLLPDKINYSFTSYSDLSNPGIFRKSNKVYEAGHKNPNYYKGKVILLVNEETISMSEILTMICSYAPNNQVIGTMTRGVLGHTAYIPFINQYGTRMTGIGVYYPNGNCTYPNGIVLDNEIPVTPDNAIKGKEYLIEFAKKFCTPLVF